MPALRDLALWGTGGARLEALRAQAAGRERRACDAPSDAHGRLSSIWTVLAMALDRARNHLHALDPAGRDERGGARRILLAQSRPGLEGRLAGCRQIQKSLR